MPNTFQSQSTQGSSHAGQRRSPVRLMFVLVLVQLFSVILDGLTKPAGQIYPQQDTDAKQAWKGLPQNGGTAPVGLLNVLLHQATHGLRNVERENLLLCYYF